MSQRMYALTAADVAKLKRDLGRLERQVYNLRQQMAQQRKGKVYAQLAKGVLDEALVYGETATVSIWRGRPPDEADSGVNYEDVACFLLSSGEEIATGSRVDLGLIDGFWEVIATRCP